MLLMKIAEILPVEEVPFRPEAFAVSRLVIDDDEMGLQFGHERIAAEDALLPQGHVSLIPTRVREQSVLVGKAFDVPAAKWPGRIVLFRCQAPEETYDIAAHTEASAGKNIHRHPPIGMKRSRLGKQHDVFWYQAHAIGNRIAVFIVATRFALN
jgi:hypothetical protein